MNAVRGTGTVILFAALCFNVVLAGISRATAQDAGRAFAQTPGGTIVVAQASRRGTGQTGAPARRTSEETVKQKNNAWVVGLAAGKLEGAPIRLAEELSRVLDDGNDMQVLPIITRGPSYNVHALLYLRGIDLAVINADVLDSFKNDKNISNIGQRINYITQLFLSEFHVLARPEIKSLADLAGKPVNFNTKGTSAAFSGPAIFKRLGIKVKEMFIPHPIAMRKMKKSDEIAAVVFVTGKPVRPLVKKKWPAGFRLLSAQYNKKLSDYYLPTSLTSSDYPNLIAKGERVATVAVPTVLAAYNWKKDRPRYHKVRRFIEYMFKRWARLQKPPFHPKWKDINLAAKIPGWRRLPAMQEYLDKTAAATKSKRLASTDTTSARKMKRAFDQFLRQNLQLTGAAELSNSQKTELFKQFLQIWQGTSR